MRVKEPMIDGSATGGTVEPGTVVRLACDTPGARIYYTIDGSPAELHIEGVKVMGGSSWPKAIIHIEVV